MSSTLKPLPLEAVEIIWDWLTKRYGAVFLDMWSWSDDAGLQEIKQAWSEELAGFTEQELRTGLIGCKRYCEMPPTLPKFMRLCRPPVEYESMFYEAVKCMARRGTGLEKWPSKAVYWAAVKIGAFDLKNGSWATLQKRWVSALDEMLASADLPEIPEREDYLLPPAQRMIIRECGLKAYVESLQEAGSSKAWAEGVFKRHAAGEALKESELSVAEQLLGRNRPAVEARAA